MGRVQALENGMKHGLSGAWVAILLGMVLYAPVARSEGGRLPPPGNAGNMPISSAVTLAVPEGVAAGGRESSDGRMRGRMTPEERRSLREDVTGAGRTLYRPDDKRPAPGR